MYSKRFFRFTRCFGFLVGRLIEMHGDVSSAKAEAGEAGTKIDRPEGYEPPIQETVWDSGKF